MGLLDKIYSAVGGLLVAGACSLSPQPAEAETFDYRRHETAAERAQGGAGLALDRHVPSNMAFSEPGFNIGLLRLDYDGSLSEILRLRDAFDDNPFADAFEEGLTPAERIDEFLAVTDASISLDTRLYFDFLRVSYTHDSHTVYVGGYGDLEAGIALAGPGALTSESLVVEGHTLNDFVGWYDPKAPEYFAFRLLTVIGEYVDSPDAHLDVGDGFTLLRMIGRTDLGCYMGYARRFETSGDAEIGLGIQARYFHRWLSDYYVYEIPSVIDSLDDIAAPQHRGVEGDGLAFDMFTTVRFNDPVFNTVVTAGIDNIGVVWYDDDTAGFEMPRPSIGAAIYPLHSVGHDNWVIAADVENMGHGLATFQVGTLYRIPIRLGRSRQLDIVPRAGVEVNGRDVFGDYGHDSITAGLTANMGLSGIAGTFEYDFSDDTYRLGIGISVGF